MGKEWMLGRNLMLSSAQINLGNCGAYWMKEKPISHLYIK
jgi:hypothetical protein